MIKDEEINNLRKNYYEAISDLEDDYDIINSLPTPEFGNFFELMDGIIEKLNDDVNFYQQMLEELEKDSLEYEQTIEYLKTTKKKIKLCFDRKNNVMNRLNSIDGKLKNGTNRNIIFAKTRHGRNKFASGLKFVPAEYYLGIEESLEMLEEVDDLFANKSKIKRFLNNNKLNGIYEVKIFKVRIYFKLIDNDNVYVFFVRLKKDDNSTKDREGVIKRATGCNDDYLEVLDSFQNEVTKQQIIDENLQIRKEIYQILQQSSRGIKK